ncbi:MAG: polyprenyl synthetase family protein [Bacteroidales bacterium]
MYTFKECQDIFEKHLKKMKLPEMPALLYEPINYTLNSDGKRIRPVITLMTCNLFSGSIEPAINCAISIELFHNFTLLHDDIMDKSDIRRGRETVHKKWNGNVAILSGDTMMIKAFEYLSKSPSELLPEILRIFNDTAIGVCEGQQFDMDFETQKNVTVSDYLKMIELKTSVLIAASMKIGAICGGAGQKDAGYLYEFGKNLGIAFQLQDDLLDVYADQDIFGKVIGNDIVANKKTFLLISALENANEDLLKELINWLEVEEFDRHEKIRAVTDIYNQLKIKELTEQKMAAYYQEATLSFEKVSVDSKKKIFLKELADSLMKRKK